MFIKLKNAASYIQTKIKTKPTVGIILGSGLGAFVEVIKDKVIIPYSEIPGFKQCTVEGHDGRMIIGKVGDKEVAVLQGRLHVYEGHSMEEIVFPTRVLATIGVETLILTNAAGGINLDFKPGDLVLISDHINLMGQNPLVGPNINELGPRFPDMTEAYNREIQSAFVQAGKNMGMDMKKGVYVGLLGPTYETPAEIRMLKAIGGDMVGMSTVPESIAANHLGIRVAGISCITNMAAGLGSGHLNHEEVKEMALRVMQTFSKLIVEGIRLFK